MASRVWRVLQDSTAGLAESCMPRESWPFSWWLDTCVTADPIRRLPTIPSPPQALSPSPLTTASTLTRVGAYPWLAAPASPADTTTRPVIARYSRKTTCRSSPEAPPIAPPARWAYLPSRGECPSPLRSHL